VIEPSDIIDTTNLETNVKSDVLISTETMLRVLSEALGQPVLAFTDEPTMNAWWLRTK
jgi:hypothetical protein